MQQSWGKGMDAQQTATKILAAAQAEQPRKTTMMAANRKRLIVAAIGVAMVAIGLFQYYSQSVHEQYVAERGIRCAKQVAAPYVPIKGDASCFGWQRKSSNAALLAVVPWIVSDL